MMRPYVPLIFCIAFASSAQAQTGLSYTGDTNWDASTGTMTFLTSGQMPTSKEDFFWKVPADVRRIVVAKDVTVTGGFRVMYREQGNPLHILGEDRESSVIFGTDEQKWTAKNGIGESDKWQYGSISVVEDAEVYVTNLTARNPRGYNVSGYANEAVIHVSQCTLIDDRDGDNNNSDGFFGSAGSSIRDSLISTSDDAIKVYQDITIENVIIRQHRNGAALQLGWDQSNSAATAKITNLTIEGVDPEDLYNMAPITWEAGGRGVRNLFIDGLRVQMKGKVYSEDTGIWAPVGLLESKPTECTLNMTVKRAELNGLPLGIRRSRGEISIEPQP